MPGPYTGSVYLGEQPSQYRPRSFKDEFVDPAKQRWLEESNLIPDDKLEHTKSGSTFMEFDDPTAPGGKRYVARKNTDLGDLNQGAGITRSGGEVTYGYTDPSGERKTSKGRVMSFKGASGADEQFVTKAKNYGNKRYTNAEFEQYGPKFEEEMTRRKMQTQEDEAAAKKAREEAAARKGRIEEATAVAGLGITSEKARRQLAKDMPTPGESVEQARLKLMQDELGRAETKRARDEGRKSVLMQGADIPGYSNEGEKAAREALQQGADVPMAESRAAVATQQEINELRRLESSGIPRNIRQAQAMRDADPDLRKVRSFVPERNKIAEEASIAGEINPFLEDLGKKMDAEDISWDFWNSGSMDPLTDLDPDVKARVASDLADRILQIQDRVPALAEDTGAIYEAIGKRMLQRGYTQADVDALLGLIK